MIDGTLRIGRITGINGEDAFTVDLGDGIFVNAKNTFGFPIAVENQIASATEISGEWHIVSVQCPAE